MGGSSKQTIGYKYLLGVHQILCAGPIDNISLIKVADKVAWAGSNTGGSITINLPALFGGDKREGGIVGTLDVEMGLPTQGQNSYLVSKLDNTVPGFRGVVGLVLHQMNLGNNPYLKPWSVRAQRIHVRQDNVAQWYDAKAAVGESYQLTADHVSWKYLITTLSDGADYSASAFDDSAWLSGFAPFGNTPGSGVSGPGFATSPATFVPGGAGKRVWIRSHLAISKLPNSITLDLLHDDEATVYFNGTVVHSISSFGHDLGVTLPTTGLVVGDNVIAAKVSDSGATDVWLDLNLTLNYDTLDMNPAHIIRECLTDPDWGLGYQDADADDTSFIACADTLFSEGLGMSVLWDKQTRVEDFITTVLKHIDGVMYVSRSTGKFVLKLIRNDYDPSTLISLDESSIQKVANPSQPTFADGTNTVTVNFWNLLLGTDDSVTISDTAMVQMQGQVIGTTLDYPGLTNPKNATVVAQRDLRSLTQPFLSCEVYADSSARNLNVGDCFKFTWSKWNVSNMIMRVLGIVITDGKTSQVRINCTQDIYSTSVTTATGAFSGVGSSFGSGTSWTNPSTAPTTAISNSAVVEAPYYQLVGKLGQTGADSFLSSNDTAGHAVAFAVNTNEGINFQMWSDSGSGYSNVDSGEFCASGTLVGSLTKTATSATLTGMSAIDLATVSEFFQIDDELFRLDTINTTTGAITFGRAVLDTVPATHSAGARAYFWQADLSYDPTEYVSGETINIKLAPQNGAGALDYTGVSAQTVVMNQRAWRPYPPGNLQINGSPYPSAPTGALTISWAHRDRTSETGSTLYDHTYGNIGPEANTTYRVRGYIGGVLSFVSEPIAGTSIVWTPAASGTVVIDVYSKRDGVYSLYGPSHSFSYTSGGGGYGGLTSVPTTPTGLAGTPGA